jgi:hypothetical protein
MAYDLDDGDDLAADILAAMGGVSAAQAPSSPPAAAAAPPAAAPAASPPPTQQQGSTPPARDASGKFAAATPPRAAGEAQPQASSPPPAAASPSQGQGQSPVQGADHDKIPAGLSAPIKAAWATLSPEVRAEFQRREADFDRGRAGMEGKAALANRFEELFSSRKDRLAMAGMDPISAVQRLLAAQDVLDRDPRAGLLALAQAYGIHPSQLAQTAPRQQAPQPQLPPALQALAGRLSTLEGTLTQQTQAQKDAERQQLAQHIQAFASDPKHIYFENVRGDVAKLLSSGQAGNLAEAYDKAIWASPEIRPLLLQQQQTELQAQARAQQGAKVSQARSAGGSVVGSPTPGSSPAQAANPNASIEDDVRAAFAAHGSRA